MTSAFDPFATGENLGRDQVGAAFDTPKAVTQPRRKWRAGVPDLGRETNAAWSQRMGEAWKADQDRTAAELDQVNSPDFDGEISAGASLADRYSGALWGIGQEDPADQQGIEKLEKPGQLAGPGGPAAAQQPQPLEDSPGYITMFPVMGLAAIRVNLGGAWQLFTLAKNLDQQGRGAVPLDQLRRWASDLGVTSKTWRRWLNAARSNDLVRDVQRAGGDWWLILASYQTAAAAVGCDRVTRKASIRAADLVGEGWRSRVWGAYVATHRGRPISRAKLEDITQVPQSTQRAYENLAGVVRRSSYAISDRPVSHLSGVREFETQRAAPFVFWDKANKRHVIAWRLPDSRDASATADSLGRGRARKINKALKAIRQRESGLSYMQQALSFDAEEDSVYRLFHKTQPQLRTTSKQLAEQTDQPDELYRLLHNGPRSDFWQPLPYRLGDSPC